MHPFMNFECPSFSTAAKHFVKDAKGLPALRSWWQGDITGYYDFTRPEAGKIVLFSFLDFFSDLI